ncbi:hypothetical protein N7447_007831 [Penicillium robsamsonii]|uniref:uncharacterized protein n=1 Tax=Penicillium robsamsonii TaxID=1792511 RepID=UPI002546ABE8|nr:uncharacterized protein N7447_007831 [Penicillium robsamsonii]KAJ5817823.1 hypothetical protein N7447_007831 [Penicillium robsamsonii]
MIVQLDNRKSIIDHCHCAEDRLIGGSNCGNQFVKLPDRDLVVKFSRHVSSHEAKNQQKAYKIIDPNIVIVPRVHDFFVDDEGWGYMVSDFIRGKTIDHLPDSHIQRLANVLEHFRSITADSAGSLGGDTNNLTISNVQQVEEWFNSRLFPDNGKVQFDTSLSVLFPPPRNVIWLDDDRICLLDWASAGFYPRPLEFASLFFQEYHFSERLLNAISFGPGCDREEQQRICQALYNNERYSFGLRDILEGSSHQPADGISPLPLTPEPQNSQTENDTVDGREGDRY